MVSITYGSIKTFKSCILSSIFTFKGGCAKTEDEEAAGSEEDAGASRGSGVCKWFNVRMGFGFLSMTNIDGTPLDEPVDVFVHQVRPYCLNMSLLIYFGF